MKYVFRVTTTIIVSIFAIALFANFFKILNNQDIPSIFGYAYINVTKNTMEDTIDMNDLAILSIKNKNYKDNDILVYKEDKRFYVSRLIRIENNTYIIKGDHELKEKSISASSITGKYLFRVRKLGFVDTLTTEPAGLMFLAILAMVLAFFKHRKTEMF